MVDRLGDPLALDGKTDPLYLQILMNGTIGGLLARRIRLEYCGRAASGVRGRGQGVAHDLLAPRCRRVELRWLEASDAEGSHEIAWQRGCSTPPGGRAAIECSPEKSSDYIASHTASPT